MTKVAAYIRVSSKGQKLDSQRQEIERYIRAQDFDNVQWFKDKATGANTERPGFRALQRAVGRREVDTVVAWKLDRAFRNALDCLQTVEEWDRLGVSLRIIDLGGQPIDTKSAAGKFMLTVVAAVAEMERATSKERQRAGIEAARARGAKWGGRKTGSTTIDYRRAEKLVAKGLRVSEVAQALGCSRASLYGYFNARGGACGRWVRRFR